MAVLSVTEAFPGLGSHDRIQPDGRIIGDGRRFFDVIFDESDNPAGRPFIAKSESAVDPTTGVRVPQLGDLHPAVVAGWVYVIDRRVAPTAKSAFMYRVVVQYEEIRDPTQEPAILEWLSASTMEPVCVGTDDDDNIVPLLTSSDEPFDPPPMNEYDDLVLRATYSVEEFDPVVAHNFRSAINDRPIMIRGFTFPAGAAKVRTYIAREIRAITDRSYLDVVAEIQFRKTGWKRRFPDLGFRTKQAIVGGIQTYANILDTEGNEISEPVMLDGSGQRGNSLVNTYREYWVNDRLDFALVFGAFLS